MNNFCRFRYHLDITEWKFFGRLKIFFLITKIDETENDSCPFSGNYDYMFKTLREIKEAEDQ